MSPSSNTKMVGPTASTPALTSWNPSLSTTASASSSVSKSDGPLSEDTGNALDRLVGTSVGRCIVLPGSKYTPDGPMFFFAAQVALIQGWDVRQVWWEVPEFSSDAEEIAWVGSQLDAEVDG